jgi:hypothetical protein
MSAGGRRRRAPSFCFTDHLAKSPAAPKFGVEGLPAEPVQFVLYDADGASGPTGATVAAETAGAAEALFSGVCAY